MIAQAMTSRNSPIKLTVAVCTFNRSALLRATLQALEAQVVHPPGGWDAIVIDNNSSDNTTEVVREFVRRGIIPGLRLDREATQGLSFARRKAVVESCGDAVAFVDDDCRPEADWVQQAIAFLKAYPAAGAVGGQVLIDWEEEPVPAVRSYAQTLAYQDHGTVPVRALEQTLSFLVGAGLVVRRQALVDSGWLNWFRLTDRRGAGLSAGGDTEMVLRIRHAGHEAWYNPQMRIWHFVPADRSTVQHLCALSAASGEDEPLLWHLQRAPGWPRWLTVGYACAVSCRDLARSACTRVIYRVTNRQEGAAMARIDWHRGLGRLRGAVRFACSRGG
jgi:glycosyltransferase involved in cell wall biosynthesis